MRHLFISEKLHVAVYSWPDGNKYTWTTTKMLSLTIQTRTWQPVVCTWQSVLCTWQINSGVYLTDDRQTKSVWLLFPMSSGLQNCQGGWNRSHLKGYDVYKTDWIFFYITVCKQWRIQWGGLWGLKPPPCWLNICHRDLLSMQYPFPFQLSNIG